MSTLNISSKESAEKKVLDGFADKDGVFRRKDSTFRSWISSEEGAQFPPEKDRYALYINWACPWAHRANLVRSLKGLEDIIQLVVTDVVLTEDGWLFTGNMDTMPKDPIYGFTKLKQLYLKADPNYQGRFTVPVLWDKTTHTIVNNESSEIIRMFYSGFDSLLPPSSREVNKPNGGFLPPSLKPEIDSVNEWIYNTINNGVYKSGFATSQKAYEDNVIPLFQSLDRVEKILADSKESYLFGKYITEADIRLFTTIVRFDVAYYTLFKCNLKMIRHDYPFLQKWLTRLYWDESEDTKGAFKKTTYFAHIKKGYSSAAKGAIIPVGPTPNMLPLDN